MDNCPTPTKVRYDCKSDAKRALKRNRNILDHRVRPYRCVCDRWHLGHLGTEVIAGDRTRAEVYT